MAERGTTSSKSSQTRAMNRFPTRNKKYRSISGSALLESLAVTISGTLVVCFLIFNFATDPLVYKIAIVSMSFVIFLFVYRELKMGDGSDDDVANLGKSLRTHERILKNPPAIGAHALEGVVMSMSYSPAVVRVFAVGASAAAIGLVLTIAGAAIGNFSSQYAGAGLLAIGLLAATLAVLRAERLGEQQSR
jgi:hypothetical protein